MSFMVVVLLGGLWASILLPGVLRARRDASPRSSIDSFERSMGMLAHYAGTPVHRPSGRHVMVLEEPARFTPSASRIRMLRRRRTVFTRLLGATALAGVPAIVVGDVFAHLFLGLALCLSTYVAVLVHLRVRREELRRKLRPLPPPMQRRQRRVVHHEHEYARRVGHG